MAFLRPFPLAAVRFLFPDRFPFRVFSLRFVLADHP